MVIIMIVTMLIIMIIIMISFGVVMPHTVVLPEERARLQAEVFHQEDDHDADDQEDDYHGTNDDPLEALSKLLPLYAGDEGRKFSVDCKASKQVVFWPI